MEAKEQLGVLDAWLVQPPSSSHPRAPRGLFHPSMPPSSAGASSNSMFSSHRCGETEAQRGGSACPYSIQPPTLSPVTEACAHCWVSSGQMVTLSGLKFHQRL